MRDRLTAQLATIVVGLAAIACADRSTSDDDIGADESTDSTDSDASTDSDGSTDSSDSSEDDGSTGSTDSTDSSDGMLEEVTYYAEPYIGGIDRLWIYRVGLTPEGVC